MNKKFTSIMSVAMVALSLAACGRAAAGEEGNNHAAGENNTAEEARTGASITNDADLFAQNFGLKGWWIGATESNLTLDKDLVVEGDFRDKNLDENDYKRKIALYTQDADHNVLDRFTLTVPRIVVKSPNTVISKGIVHGDVYVEANGFNLDDATIEGNIIFSKQEYKDSANLDDGHVNGDVTVEEA